MNATDMMSTITAKLEEALETVKTVASDALDAVAEMVSPPDAEGDAATLSEMTDETAADEPADEDDIEDENHDETDDEEEAKADAATSV